MLERAMVQIAATKRTTLHRMLDGTTLETGLSEARREPDDHFKVTDLKVAHLDARLVAGSITTSTKWVFDMKLPTAKRFLFRTVHLVPRF